ncbi:hypothetical protein CCP4SC76_810008 [Gammaproteobacteria bacterium]
MITKQTKQDAFSDSEIVEFVSASTPDDHEAVKAAYDALRKAGIELRRCIRTIKANGVSCDLSPIADTAIEVDSSADMLHEYLAVKKLCKSGSQPRASFSRPPSNSR